MTCRNCEGRPGYGQNPYLPPSYQVVGPDQVPALTAQLAILPGDVTTVHPAIRFEVVTPNVRVRTRVELSLEPAQAETTDVDASAYTVMEGVGSTLFVAERAVSRTSKRRAPTVRNVVGTAAAPLAIPTDTRLWGYAFEVETNGQILTGVFTPSNQPAAAPAGAWWLSVRYESVERLSDVEWQQFLQQCGIRIGSPSVLG